MSQMVTIRDFLGTELEEDFMEFDLTEVEEVLCSLREVSAIDISHAELLQQQALHGADIVIAYLGKIVKTVGYLESRVNTVRNTVSLKYVNPDGGRTTNEMRTLAGNASPEVEEIQIRLARAKASKMVLDKKYDILIKTHHQYKDIAQGLRKGVLGYAGPATSEVPEGW